ncbi:DUF732 domain-containing protein [Mycobacterium kyogaense]|uniref:DUF732 domain-containing protein n=1 Tax=Mycobacterium kyogaense TaxID=2212479 RepID=UPI000DAC450B|nr:DUF732 domain-containing protein [Mycobacterium kyogaense]
MQLQVKRSSCVAVATVLMLFASPDAHADDSSLVDKATGLGFTISAVNIVSMAHSACYFLSRNRNPGQVVERIRRYGQVTPDAAQRFMSLAVTEYCPQYSAQTAP